MRNAPETVTIIGILAALTWLSIPTNVKSGVSRISVETRRLVKNHTRTYQQSGLDDANVAAQGRSQEKRQQEQPKKEQSPEPIKSNVRPALLGEGLLGLPVYESNKFLEKSAEAIGKMIQSLGESGGAAWLATLQALTGSKYTQDQLVTTLPLFFPMMDAVWDKDRFLPEKFEIYNNRLRSLPMEAAVVWRNDLDKLTRPVGENMTDLKAIGFLIQIDRLFSRNEFRPSESASLLTRLRSLPPNAVKTLSNASSCYPSQAAIALIQHDPLFGNNAYEENSSAEALRVLKAALGGGQ